MVTKPVTEQLKIADVVIVNFPEHDPQGREQEGYRPAVIVGIPEKLAKPRFQLVVIVPVTTDRSQNWAISSPKLYPRLQVGDGGLTQNSIVLLDQVRAIDFNRVVRYLGTLTPQQYQPISDGLTRMFSQHLEEESDS